VAPERKGAGGVEVEELPSSVRTKRPPLFRVILHNDDFTPMEVVVYVVQVVFRRSEAEARAIMLEAHNKGRAVAGVYTFEVAETKVAEVARLANEAQVPLLSTLEPEAEGEEA
jgi:ATP-dependent Clp protease adaptor protein ClpS